MLQRGLNLKPGRIVPVFAILAAILWQSVPAAASFGDPKGFLNGEQVSEKLLYPGVKYFRADGSHLGNPMVTHVVTVDMTNPGTKLQMLPGERLVTASSGQYFRRSRVSHLQQDNGALAAVNAAFFDISATMTPSGLHVRDGMVLRPPQSGSPSFAVTQSGLPFIHAFSWNRTIRRGSSTFTFQGVNANSLNNDNIVLYQYPWDRSPGRDADFITNGPITEVVFEKVSFTKSQDPAVRHVLRGRVLEVRTNNVSVGLNATNFVLTGVGTARAFLGKMTAGSTVDVDWLFTGLPAGIDWNRVHEVVSGRNLLIVDGVLQEGSGSHWDTLHPRTAIGINEENTRVLFVVIEGRQSGRAAGMSLDSVRDYMRHMGVHNALEFDGGGSSTMAGRVDGIDKLISTPSDGSERYVPSGLGVMPVPEVPDPFFQNVRITAGHDAAAVSWETPEPATSWLLYGSEGYDFESIRNDAASTRHTVLLHGLQPHSVYYFRMVAENPLGKRISHGLELTTGVSEVVDNPDAIFSGTWSAGTAGIPYGSNYQSANVVIGSVPSATATFRPNLPASGAYDLHVWYTPGVSRTTAARYDVRHQAGTNLVTQSQVTGGNNWTLLASNVSFALGTNGYVRVRNDSTAAGVVIADAFRWTLRNPEALPPGAVPEWWREHFFGVNGPAAHLDSDGDGYTLYQEYFWGTVPNDAASRPRTDFARTGSQTLRVTIAPLRSDRVYHVESSTNLATWTAFTGSVAGNNGIGVVDLPIVSGTTNRFYRVKVGLQ